MKGILKFEFLARYFIYFGMITYIVYQAWMSTTIIYWHIYITVLTILMLLVHHNTFTAVYEVFNNPKTTIETNPFKKRFWKI